MNVGSRVGLGSLLATSFHHKMNQFSNIQRLSWLVQLLVEEKIKMGSIIIEDILMRIC